MHLEDSKCSLGFVPHSQRYKMARVFLLAYCVHTLIWVYEETDENSANKNGIVALSMNFPLYIYLSIAIHIPVYTRVCICIYIFVRSFLTVKVSSSIHKKRQLFSCLLVYSVRAKLFVLLGSVSCL